jgi:hypothetical protein
LTPGVAAVEVEVSLDNVTFLGRFEDVATVVEYLDDLRTSDPEAVAHLGTWPGPNESFKVSWSLDGAHISVTVERLAYGWGTSAGLMEKWKHADDIEHPDRVEFNPNKVSERVLGLLSMGLWEKVTRCDVALDYHGLQIGSFVFRRPRVKSAIHLGSGAHGAVETVYLGRRTSDRFVRVYDKRLELGVPGADLTRLEGVGRRDWVLHPDLLKGVKGYACGIPEGLPALDAAWLALALHYPEKLSDAHWRVRRDVVALLDRCGESLAPDPEAVYRDALPRLSEWVEGLRAGAACPHASVYQ